MLLHRFLNFAVGIPGLFSLTLIMKIFSFGQSDLEFGQTMRNIKPHRNDRIALNPDSLIKLEDLIFVKQKAAVPGFIMIEAVAEFIS